MAADPSVIWYICLVAAATLLIYCYLVGLRLDASRFERQTSFPTDEQLLADGGAWRDIDVLKTTSAGTYSIAEATGRRYLVTGASGNLGAFVVELLHRRGERRIYCMDISPLPKALTSLEGVHFVKCNITDAEAVHAVFEGIKPDIVFHLCAAIRFWERSSFTYRLSAAVNIDGTKHVLDALKSLPEGSSDKTLVFCSSAAVQLFEPLFLRLGWNYRSGYPTSWTLTDDREIPDKDLASHCYAVTKAAADRLVREANGVQGLTTGVLRPGMSVCGPNDLLAGMIMRQDTNPTVINSHAQHIINCQDLAAAFLLYERAILERPQEVVGEHFLVTGDHNNYTWRELRHMIQLFASRNLKYTPIHPFALYALSHVLEAICWTRYYCLLPVYKILYETVPSPHPKWMEWGKLYQLQPAIWNTACVDVDIDDSRARKVLGYRNAFTTPQTLRWIVDTIESSQVPASELARQAASKASDEVLPPLNGVTNMLKKDT